mmetsp:Transcript_48515/g.157245  ORF Transcript_48515/g.157245 Transcript_48515/m.157245 type:complete len:219 (-) Transcript_48515:558-1214(-)
MHKEGTSRLLPARKHSLTPPGSAADRRGSACGRAEACSRPPSPSPRSRRRPPCARAVAAPTPSATHRRPKPPGRASSVRSPSRSPRRASTEPTPARRRRRLWEGDGEGKHESLSRERGLARAAAAAHSSAGDASPPERDDEVEGDDLPREGEVADGAAARRLVQIAGGRRGVRLVGSARAERALPAALAVQTQHLARDALGVAPPEHRRVAVTPGCRR